MEEKKLVVWGKALENKIWLWYCYIFISIKNESYNWQGKIGIIWN